MTQLIINGTEAVLPKKFSTTVKRENSFFTKSGEYTYDCTLNLDNPVNCQLFEFLNRLNKSEQVDTKRTATLIADGHVYCRGTEVVTRWTEETVTIQIVSGESELNYFIGQDQKIEDLDLGEIEDFDALSERCETITALPIHNKTYPESDFCLVPVWTENGCLNLVRAGTTLDLEPEGISGSERYCLLLRPTPQPYLCAVVRRLLKALGYNNDEETHVNQLEDTVFKDVFLVNTVRTPLFAKMLPGWTVKEFMEEVEKLTGIVFVTNNRDTEHPTCEIILKNQYYQNATQFTLRDVIDAYEAEVQDEDGREAEWTSSSVSYDIPDHSQANIMRLPENIRADAETVECSSYQDVRTSAAGYAVGDKVLFHEATEDRYYIILAKDAMTGLPFLQEVDLFRDLKRENVTSTLKIAITPAPMIFMIGQGGGEYIYLCSSRSKTFSYDYTEDEEGEDEEGTTFLDAIEGYSQEESSKADLYCAIYDGFVESTGVAVPFTDAYHCTVTNGGSHTGSLSLQWLDTNYFQGGYEVDTRHAYTVETYDPNVIDPRQVYVIRNRRFVCRDVEEVITHEGRQPKWKGTFFPIRVSDEALLRRWVLTHGVWDDHAVWLDDGRWIDDYDGQPV